MTALKDSRCCMHHLQQLDDRESECILFCKRQMEPISLIREMDTIVGPVHRAEFDCCGFPDGTRRAQSLPKLKVEANEALRMACGNCAVCERYGITCGAKGRRAGVPKTSSTVDVSEVRSHRVAEKIADGSGYICFVGESGKAMLIGWKLRGGGSNARKEGNSRGDELMTFMLYENEIPIHGPWPGRVSSVGGGTEGASRQDSEAGEFAYYMCIA